MNSAVNSFIKLIVSILDLGLDASNRLLKKMFVRVSIGFWAEWQIKAAEISQSKANGDEVKVFPYEMLIWLISCCTKPPNGIIIILIYFNEYSARSAFFLPAFTLYSMNRIEWKYMDKVTWSGNSFHPLQKSKQFDWHPDSMCHY